MTFEVRKAKAKLKKFLKNMSMQTLMEINQFMVTNVMPKSSSTINTAVLIDQLCQIMS
jgi:hypothetical protein